MLLALPLLAAALATAPAREPAPGPGCFDAREVAEVVQADDYTLGVRLRDESRFRIDLASRCAAVDDAPARLVSPGGWICGRPGVEAVQVGERICRVAQARAIDPRGFAALAMARPKATRELDRIEVVGTRRRGFTGSPAYCVDTQHLRGWHEDGDGIIVEVGRVHSGGNRFYRLELGGSCQTLASSAHLVLQSGVGQSTVCGYPGDRALIRSEVALGGYEGDIYRPISERSLVTREGCPVTAVYPIDPKARRAD
ncbi:DUF6491 family protein [Lysobacter xanthus]